MNIAKINIHMIKQFISNVLSKLSNKPNTIGAINMWNTDGNYTIQINARGQTTTQNFTGPITPEQVKAAARSVNLSQFMVYDGSGNMLEQSAFPYSGNVVIKEYNAAKIE